MPMYEYRCEQGHVLAEYRTVSGRSAPATCRCGLAAEKVILSPPRVFGDFAGYESPASGKWIEGRRAREEDLKRTGCRPYEAGEREEMMRRQTQADRALDAKVDEVVEKTLYEITS